MLVFSSRTQRDFGRYARCKPCLFPSKIDLSYPLSLSFFFFSNAPSIDLLLLSPLPLNLHPCMRLWNQFTRYRCEWTCYGCYVLSGWYRRRESWTWYVSFVHLFFSLLSFINFVAFSKRPGIKPKLDALRTLYEGKKIIVGRDKLDVVKGVLQKVCFSRFRGPPKTVFFLK